MKYFLALFLASASISYAQEIRHFTPYFQKMVDTKTKNERRFFFSDSTTQMEDYTNGKLENKALISGLNRVEDVNEFACYYTSRGNKLNYKDYFKNVTGVFNYYLKDSLHQTIVIKNGRFLYAQVWDMNGSVLENGNGHAVKETPDKDEQVHEFYKDSIQVVSYGIRKAQKDTIYYTYDQVASPKNGIQGFYKDVFKALKYPGIARLVGKEGLVYVQFIIDEQGKLRDFKPLTNEGFRFETKTIEKLETSRNWNPAIYKNRFVKMKFVIPVRFELN